MKFLFIFLKIIFYIIKSPLNNLIDSINLFKSIINSPSLSNYEVIANKYNNMRKFLSHMLDSQSINEIFNAIKISLLHTIILKLFIISYYIKLLLLFILYCITGGFIIFIIEFIYNLYNISLESKINSFINSLNEFIIWFNESNVYTNYFINKLLYNYNYNNNILNAEPVPIDLPILNPNPNPIIKPVEIPYPINDPQPINESQPVWDFKGNMGSDSDIVIVEDIVNDITSSFLNINWFTVLDYTCCLLLIGGICYYFYTAGNYTHDHEFAKTMFANSDLTYNSYEKTGELMDGILTDAIYQAERNKALKDALIKSDINELTNIITNYKGWKKWSKGKDKIAELIDKTEIPINSETPINSINSINSNSNSGSITPTQTSFNSTFNDQSASLIEYQHNIINNLSKQNSILNNIKDNQDGFIKDLILEKNKNSELLKLLQEKIELQNINVNNFMDSSTTPVQNLLSPTSPFQSNLLSPISPFQSTLEKTTDLIKQIKDLNYFKDKSNEIIQFQNSIITDLQNKIDNVLSESIIRSDININKLSNTLTNTLTNIDVNLTNQLSIPTNLNNTFSNRIKDLNTLNNLTLNTNVQFVNSLHPFSPVNSFLSSTWQKPFTSFIDQKPFTNQNIVNSITNQNIVNSISETVDLFNQADAFNIFM